MILLRSIVLHYMYSLMHMIKWLKMQYKWFKCTWHSIFIGNKNGGQM